VKRRRGPHQLRQIDALVETQVGELGSVSESGRFRGVMFRTARVGLGKLFACLNLRYRPLQSINFAWCSAA
jgi:hypothetical protein